jgi:hypothetical protein
MSALMPFCGNNAMCASFNGDSDVLAYVYVKFSELFIMENFGLHQGPHALEHFSTEPYQPIVEILKMVHIKNVEFKKR